MNTYYYTNYDSDMIHSDYYTYIVIMIVIILYWYYS